MLQEAEASCTSALSLPFAVIAMFFSQNIYQDTFSLIIKHFVSSSRCQSYSRRVQSCEQARDGSRRRCRGRRGRLRARTRPRAPGRARTPHPIGGGRPSRRDVIGAGGLARTPAGADMGESAAGRSRQKAGYVIQENKDRKELEKQWRRYRM